MASPEAGKVELSPLEGATSGVWRYFGFPSKDGKFVEPDKNKRTSVHCKLCAKVLKYAGNTTNLRYHLKHSHSAEFEALQLAQALEKEVLSRQIPIPRSLPRWNKLTDAVCYFIAKDMQPIDTVITIIMFM